MARKCSCWRFVGRSRTIRRKCCACLLLPRTSRTTGGFSMANFMKTSHPRLVISRTRMRVSFAGGGTDLADFYEHGHGAFFSAAINQYIYVTVKEHGSVF